VDPTDRELVDLALTGDRSAFSSLVERHSAPLWAAMARSFSDREQAREVFQETWVRAFENLHALESAARLRSWLLSIAFNLRRQWLRRRRSAELEEAERVADDPDSTGSGGLERSELRSVLESAVSELPPRQREVVELRIHLERSYAEIAAELGISEESARASFYQAMRRLRARFDETELEG
jgi:RNA polymerase sigma-70 factor (ECF subfamily)